MNFFARAKYNAITAWVRSALTTYYTPITIRNREGLREERPFIVVTNHPNTLSDVVLTVVHGYRPIYLLANAGLFRYKLSAWFFNQVYCIPIQRKQDVKRKGTSNNRKNINRVIEHLLQGGAMYIAPEGSSWLEWHLRPLKTGVSRIAFQTANAANFDTDLVIIPLGFTYEDGSSFRTGVHLEVGSAIELRNYKSLFDHDPKEAQRTLMGDIKEGLTNCMLHTNDQFQEVLLQQLGRLAQEENALEPMAQYDRQQRLLKILTQWEEHDASTYYSFLASSQYIQGILKSVDLRWADWLATEYHSSTKRNSFLAWPIACWGAINHLLPWGIPFWIDRQFNQDRTFSSTFKITASLITVPLFYVLQALLFNALLPIHWAWTILYVVSLAPAGKFAFSFYQNWKQQQAIRRARSLEGSFLEQELRNFRQDLLQKLHESILLQPTTIPEKKKKLTR
ncbi:MAG: 1-acyl-sn-glycerol-3-phosphate acyltransferase [Bacteroidota bacterium]